MNNSENPDIFSAFTAELWTTKKIPRLLYHYTSIEGARSIISNGKNLWASSFETMNDNQELKRGLEIAKSDLAPFLQIIFDAGISNDIISNWQSFINSEIKSPTLRPYILCFTESHISQLHWERYADSFKGVAIEFKNTFDLSNSDKGFWVKVVYDESTAKKQFTDYLNEATEKFRIDYQNTKDLTERLARKKIFDLFHTYLQIIFKFSVSLKENRWAGEQEWRLVLFANADRNPQSAHGGIQYRTRNSELVDYLIVDIKKCGYEMSRAKAGQHFPVNSFNGFSEFIKNHSLGKIE